jgi:hypothetical protein
MELRKFARTAVWLSVVLQVPAAETWTHVRVSVAAGEIEGTVKDEAGQQLPGVFVVAMPQRGGMAIRTTTGSDGAYGLGGLADEPYRVDFWLAGFQGTRHNQVQPGFRTWTRIDAVLLLAPVCECVQGAPSPASRRVTGRVVNDVGHPLPHALLEFVGLPGRAKTWADEEGAFLVSPPADGSWSVVASDSGFASVSQRVTVETTGPLVFRLRFVSTQELPHTEWFNRGCFCPEYLPAVHR